MNIGSGLMRAEQSGAGRKFSAVMMEESTAAPQRQEKKQQLKTRRDWGKMEQLFDQGYGVRGGRLLADASASPRHGIEHPFLVKTPGLHRSSLDKGSAR